MNNLDDVFSSARDTAEKIFQVLESLSGVDKDVVAQNEPTETFDGPGEKDDPRQPWYAENEALRRDVDELSYELAAEHERSIDLEFENEALSELVNDLKFVIHLLMAGEVNKTLSYDPQNIECYDKYDVNVYFQSSADGEEIVVRNVKRND